MRKTIVQLTHHDDWLVSVLLSSGEVYLFNTEMWPEHLVAGWDSETMGAEPESNWACVIRRAENDALFLSARHSEPYTRLNADAIGTARDLFVMSMNGACTDMSDADFARLVRR